MEKTMEKNQLIQIGEYGKRVGETHGRAKLGDHEIDLVHQLKEEGMSSTEIADKMEISRRYVYNLANFERRASIVAQYRRMARRGK